MSSTFTSNTGTKETHTHTHATTAECLLVSATQKCPFWRELTVTAATRSFLVSALTYFCLTAEKTPNFLKCGCSEPVVAPPPVCKYIKGNESQSKGSGQDFNWLDPQKQHGGTAVRNASAAHLYLKRLIHASAYATHSKRESRADPRTEAERPQIRRGDRCSLRPI